MPILQLSGEVEIMITDFDKVTEDEWATLRELRTRYETLKRSKRESVEWSEEQDDALNESEKIYFRILFNIANKEVK